MECWWWKNMAKGQTEIMGLIVIVVLVTLGMFFMVSFQSQEKQPDIKTNYQDDQLASNFLLTFLKTNSDCRNYNMEDLIQDCATDQVITCRGLDSCQYINITSEYLLNETLETWGKRYRFEVDDIVIENNCNSSHERDSAFQPISLYPRPTNVILSIDICK